MMSKKIFSHVSLIFLCLAAVYLLSFPGCAGREKKAVTLADSTIYYTPINQLESFEGISLSGKISKKTGKPLKPGTVFKLDEKAKLYASIENVFSMSKATMLHVDWVDPEGNSFFRKRIDTSPNDSLLLISSSITISPQKRDTGIYSVRFYLFRELFAEKKFQLVESINESATVKKKSKSEIKNGTEKKEKVKKTKKPKVETETVKANIVLCRKVSKKTGNPIGAATTFTIKDSAKVKAVVSIENQDIKTNEQMKFYFEWFGPDGKSFYKKRVVYTTSNPFFIVSNSISITPDKRKPGKYMLRVSFRKKIIAEQQFELVVQLKKESQ